MLEMNNPDFTELIKKFESTIKNIDGTIKAQPKYLEENIF